MERTKIINRLIRGNKDCGRMEGGVLTAKVYTQMRESPKGKRKLSKEPYLDSPETKDKQNRVEVERVKNSVMQPTFRLNT